MLDAQKTLRVISIVDGTSVDGPGLRTSIYLAGCNHHCPGCHNPESWDFRAGVLMTLGEIYAHINEQDFDVTFSGGDPMEQADNLLELVRRLKQDGRNVWCFTGYNYEDLFSDEIKSALLEYIDVLVDGQYKKEERDISLLFRGSKNQRLIDVRRSSPGKIEVWKSQL